MQLQFRTATPEDIPTLQALIQSAFRAQDTRPGWIDNLGLSEKFKIETEEIKSILDKPDSKMLLAYAANSTNAEPSMNTISEEIPVGSIGVSKRAGNLGRLFMLAVNPAYAGDGVGRQILDYGEDYCIRVWGCEKLSLNTLSVRTQLRAWYARRGYVETGDTVPFPVERFTELELPDGICMVEFEKEVARGL
jgi:GNAT superfamily N-acetyltransferase